jgi:hypothetical protein
MAAYAHPDRGDVYIRPESVIAAYGRLQKIETLLPRMCFETESCSKAAAKGEVDLHLGASSCRTIKLPAIPPSPLLLVSKSASCFRSMKRSIKSHEYTPCSDRSRKSGSFPLSSAESPKVSSCFVRSSLLDQNNSHNVGSLICIHSGPIRNIRSRSQVRAHIPYRDLAREAQHAEAYNSAGTVKCDDGSSELKVVAHNRRN